MAIRILWRWISGFLFDEQRQVFHIGYNAH